MSDLKGRTVSSSFVTIAAQGTVFVLTLASTMVLARLLLPTDFGMVAMVTTVMGFLRIFKDAGLSTATVQREGITHAQVSNLFWINVGVSGLISLALACSAPAIAWFYREPRLAGITLALAGTFLVSGATVQHMALLNRQMRFKAIALIQVGSLGIGLLAGIVMAWLNCGYWSLVVSSLLTPVAAFLLAWRASTWRPQLFTRRSGTQPLVKFGVDVAGGGFIWSLARGSDSLMIGRFFGAESLGLYSRAGLLLMRPLEQAITPMEAVLLPTLSRLQGQPDQYRRTFLAIHEAIALGGFVFCGLSLALALPLTLVVLGDKWEKAAPIFAAFAVGAIYYPLTTSSTWLFYSQGRGRDWLWASLFASAVTVCSFVAGLPFGPAGVAIAYSAAGLLLLLPIMYYMAGRSGPVTAGDLWAGFMRQLPVWVIVFGATFLPRALVANSAPFTQCLVCGTVGLLVGLGFISIYSPARKVALSIISVSGRFKTSQSGSA